MTYSDLLHKVSFDEIAPYIEKYRSNKDIALFKSHYDMLQQIEPKKKQNSKNEIVISIWPEGNTKDNQSHYLRATSILGKNWEEDLAKELVFKLGVRQIFPPIANISEFISPTCSDKHPHRRQIGPSPSKLDMS